MKNLIIFMLLILIIQPVGAINVTSKTQESWTCFDYATDYAKQNSEWGIVTISDNQFFRGVSHMVNYQMLPDGSLKIHDGMYQQDYTWHEWKGDRFYHFWTTGTPVRNYRIMHDNSDIFEKRN